ncbi:MAG: AraC family transcriptional regulator, partial [Moraxellaceae bacterium]
MNNGFLNIHDLILALAALEALLLSLALKLIPTNHRQPRNLLAVFFFLVAGMLVTTLIIWNGYLQTLEIARWDLLPLLLSVCMLLQWPTLYLYLQSLSRELQLLHWKNLAHLVPAVIVGAVILIADIDIVDWLPWNRSLLSPMELHSLEFVWAIVKCSPLGYLVACFYAEYRLRQQLKQVYSSISAYDLR